MTSKNVITLEYYKRYPESQTSRKWRKKRVHIMSVGRGWWRPQAVGYTPNQWEAWTIPFETAIAHTASIGHKDQKIEFHLADMPGNKL